MPPVITLGCRLNFAESAQMAELADAAGLHDAVIINSCAVTKEAERQSRQAIRRAKRDHPDDLIILTGCAGEITPKAYAGMKETGLLVRNGDKLSPSVWRRLARLQGKTPHAVQQQSQPRLAKVRAFLPIQQGCSHACTFCVIPQGRGAATSVAREAILAKAKELCAQGVRDITLTGVDIASYGLEQGRCHLGALVRFLLEAMPELARLRLSSLDPAIDDPLLLSLFGEQAYHERLMPHLHLSLQSGSAMILKRMRRRHSPSQALDFIHRLRETRPDMLFGADLIAGFPTETSAHFAETLAFLKQAGIAFFHIFPYAPRPNTAAARMPQLPASLIRARAAALRAFASQQQQAVFARQCGSEQKVLMETPYQGRIPAFAPIKFIAAHEPGRVIKATIESIHNGILSGVAA